MLRLPPTCDTQNTALRGRRRGSNPSFPTIGKQSHIRCPDKQSSLLSGAPVCMCGSKPEHHLARGKTANTVDYQGLRHRAVHTKGAMHGARAEATLPLTMKGYAVSTVG